MTSAAFGCRGYKQQQIDAHLLNDVTCHYAASRANHVSVSVVIERAPPDSMGIESKTERIQMIVKAAVHHLDIRGLTWEEVRNDLSIQTSQELDRADNGSLSAMEREKLIGQWTGI